MEYSPSEADSHLASQEIRCLLCNPNVHYLIHKSSPLVRILSQTNPVHNFPPYFPNINSILFSYLRLDFPNGLYQSVFPTKIL
jgi:hypothetical protein